jgi:DNA-binding transcriptional LysR family regulator
LQIAFLVRPTAGMSRGVHFEPIMQDAICMAVALKHPLARRRTVSLEEMAREPFITYSRADYPEAHEDLAKMFAHSKVKPRITEEHDGVASLIAGVESGAGVALVPESISCIAGGRLKLVPVAPPLAPLVIGAAWPKDGLVPAAERFLKAAKQVAATVK